MCKRVGDVIIANFDDYINVAPFVCSDNDKNIEFFIVTNCNNMRYLAVYRVPSGIVIESGAVLDEEKIEWHGDAVPARKTPLSPCAGMISMFVKRCRKAKQHEKEASSEHV